MRTSFRLVLMKSNSTQTLKYIPYAYTSKRNVNYYFNNALCNWYIPNPLNTNTKLYLVFFMIIIIFTPPHLLIIIVKIFIMIIIVIILSSTSSSSLSYIEIYNYRRLKIFCFKLFCTMSLMRVASVLNWWFNESLIEEHQS